MNDGIVPYHYGTVGYATFLTPNVPYSHLAREGDFPRNPCQGDFERNGEVTPNERQSRFLAYGAKPTIPVCVGSTLVVKYPRLRFGGAP
jgi:hypothetical protein